MYASPIQMTTDPSHVELLFSNDDRLTAAVEAVVAHAGERAGLSRQEQSELARATAEACEETFSAAGRNGAVNPKLRVLVSDFPNRVEVSIEESTGTGSRGSDDFGVSSKPDPVSAALQGMHVDRLHHEIREGRPRTKLVKYHGTVRSERER